MRIDKNPTNLELLRLATELAYADYNNRRANLHNKWLSDNENMLRRHKISVPYPPIPPYPTEQEIILRATRLIEFLNYPRPDLERQKLHTEVKQLITDVKQEIEQTPVVEEQPQPTQEPTNIVAIDHPVDIQPTIENESPQEDKPEKTSVIDKIKNVWR